MTTETRTCQNCKTSFTIEPEDFEFYEKMKVPAPTFCPSCRFQRRLMFRNERVLYRRMCDLCKKSIITVHDPKKRRIVYCSPCWWSDKWDALEFGVEYDPQKNFFEQFRKLQEKIPVMDLVNSYTTLESSEYVNHAGHLKNCYLIFNADYCENVCYASGATYVKDSLDLLSVGANSEFCYEDIMSGKSSRLFFSEDCFECLMFISQKTCVAVAIVSDAQICATSNTIFITNLIQEIYTKKNLRSCASIRMLRWRI